MRRGPATITLAIGAAAVIAAALSTVVAVRSTPRVVRQQWDSPPNVVLIIVDTLRQDKLGTYGYPKETSPEIDQLAAEGVRFERVIAQSSWTRPSIGSLLTSHYPRELGIYKERDEILPERFVTLAEVFGEAGYTTLGATANANINASFNFHQGFDHYLDSTVLLRWMGNSGEARAHSEQKLQSARQIFDSLLEQAKERAEPPYYLQANVMEVHEHWDDRLDLSAYEPFFRNQAFSRYLAAIRHVSAEIGRFVEALSALPGFERTIFVILSDHGEGLDDHAPVEDSAGHGLLLYESQLLVPLILYATDGSLARGTVVDAPARLLDVMPTLLDYCGIKHPDGIAGTSMMPAVDGDGAPELPPHFVAETELRSSKVIGVHGARWEYIEHRQPHAGTDPQELQDNRVRERGGQTNELAARPRESATLRAYLRRWEEAHPKAEPTPPQAPLPQLEEEQLRALGYLD